MEKIQHNSKSSSDDNGNSQLLQHLSNLQAPSSHLARQLLPINEPKQKTATEADLKSGTNGEGSYWKQPARFGADDMVIIHVCDENQQINKDFCCKRDILVAHMKYFEKFLAQNDNGYDDIDISVHCDVEIFEWLMAYIHEPEKSPDIDKSIIVSILISSEFLQIESLVELCIQQVSKNINEIIKLPIDLSCISEKLINRIAFITHPKVRIMCRLVAVCTLIITFIFICYWKRRLQRQRIEKIKY